MKTDAERMALIRQRTARLGRHIGRAACFPHRHRRDAE